jgi:hypothetical protein
VRAPGRAEPPVEGVVLDETVVPEGDAVLGEEDAVEAPTLPGVPPDPPLVAELAEPPPPD